MGITALMFSLLFMDVELKRPHLTIAQGYIESGMNPKAVGRSGEKGAWQVLEKFHGKVPRGVYKQAVQAERILDEYRLNGNRSLYKSLIKYNGRGRNAVRYANRVRRLAIQLALLDTQKSQFLTLQGV